MQTGKIYCRKFIKNGIGRVAGLFPVLAILLLLMPDKASGQELSLPELHGYKKVTDYPVYTAENLWDFIDGAADAYLSYGFIDLHVAEYKKGKNVIKLEVYRHSDHIMAFGIYSSERSSSFHFTNLGTQGYEADGAINFFKGNYYVKIRTFSKDEKTIKSSELLAASVAEMLPGETTMPVALSLFPAEGRKINEESYINESVLGHKFLSKAFKAVYETGNDKYSAYIFEKASVEEALKTVNEFLTSAGLDNVDSDSGRYMLKDGYNGTIFLAWKDKTIVMIEGLSKDQSDSAERLTSTILK